MDRKISNISFFFFLLMNIVFLYKYIIRVNEDAALISITYGLVLIILFLILNKHIKNVAYKKYSYFLLIIIVGVQLVLLFKIPVQSLNTDRWSVITCFLDALFNGDFPYLAKSHLNNPPGPFPGYYLFALPFYFIGEIGFYSLSGIFLFFIILRLQNFTDKSIFLAITLIISSSFIWYELVVRSTIFVNMAIVMLYFYGLQRINLNSFRNLVLMGLMGGIVLSTRGIIIYPFIVYFTYLFITKKEWYKLFSIIIFITIGFLLTLSPFIIWDWKLFLEYNPITLQAGFIPKIYLFIFSIVALIIGYFSKNLQVLNANLGILLFTIVSIPFFIKVLNSGIYNAIVENGFDITYFIFSAPFLMYAIFDNNNSVNIKNE